MRLLCLGSPALPSFIEMGVALQPSVCGIPAESWLTVVLWVCNYVEACVGFWEALLWASWRSSSPLQISATHVSHNVGDFSWTFEWMSLPFQQLTWQIQQAAWSQLEWKYCSCLTKLTMQQDIQPPQWCEVYLSMVLHDDSAVHSNWVNATVNWQAMRVWYWTIYCQAGVYEMVLIAVFVFMPLYWLLDWFFGCCGFGVILSNDLVNRNKVHDFLFAIKPHAWQGILMNLSFLQHHWLWTCSDIFWPWALIFLFALWV